MSLDDRWKMLEADFAKVEPKDEAERERLERMKEKMRASTEEMTHTLEQHRQEMASRKAKHEESTKRIREEVAAKEQKRLAFLDGLEAQADAIERIAARARERAGRQLPNVEGA